MFPKFATEFSSECHHKNSFSIWIETPLSITTLSLYSFSILVDPSFSFWKIIGWEVKLLRYADSQLHLSHTYLHWIVELGTEFYMVNHPPSQLSGHCLASLLLLLLVIYHYFWWCIKSILSEWFVCVCMLASFMSSWHKLKSSERRELQ